MGLCELRHIRLEGLRDYGAGGPWARVPHWLRHILNIPRLMRPAADPVGLRIIVGNAPTGPARRSLRSLRDLSRKSSFRIAH